MDFRSRDIISGLPNPLISHILSFLNTKEAASTSALSKKWRSLFASVTNLDFDDSMSENENSKSFMEFVDRVLALQGNITLNKFYLSCSNDDVDPVRVTGWISNVLGRGVSDLDLSVVEYPLPWEIFVSKSLVRLKLGPGQEDLSINIGKKDVFLPKLKTLHLDSVDFEERGLGFALLLSGCPVLEELVMMNLGWENWKFCSVSSKTLKRLRFLYEEEEPFDNPKSVSFSTPNLGYLEYSDAIANKYPKVKCDSLVEAHIGLRLSDNQCALSGNSEDFCFSEDDDEDNKKIGAAATDFLKGISNAQILYLSARFLEVLAFCGEPKPVFNNLTQLTIESNSEIGWEQLPGFLKNCPNLETLVFKGLVHKYNKKRCGDVCCCKRLKKNVASCLSSSPVKVVKIFMLEQYDEDMSETEHMKHFLEKMPLLEQLIVYYKTSYDPAVLELSKKLQRIAKIASQKCKIQVISDNLSLSSTLPSSLSKKWSAPPEDEGKEEEEEEEEKEQKYDKYYGAYDDYSDSDYY